MADGHGATKAAEATGSRLGEDGPFRAPREAFGEVEAAVEGALPGWLRGRLVRTCPARFRVGAWEASHWFDGLGMLFAFELTGEGARVRHRDLACEHARRVGDGRFDVASFATPMRRPLWRRLIEPIPTISDNTNVNVVPRGDGLVALTETRHQLRVDAATLAVTGEHAWGDALGGLMGTAHPVFDRARRVWVDVASDLGARPALVVLEHDAEGRARRVVARLPMGALPYVHAFGVTPTSVVIVAHPLEVAPWRLLFSDRGYADHMRWRDAPMRLLVVDRATGAVRAHEAPQGFVFHVASAWDDAGAVVLDACVYPDAAVVRAFDRDAMARGPVDLTPRALRYRLPRDGGAAAVEPFADEGFEFPIVDGRASGARRYTWGARLVLDGPRSRSVVVAHDAAERVTRTHAEEGLVFGEPVFARRPGATEEGDGVILTVGSHATLDRTVLRVLDARTLRPLARVTAEVPLPMGFHGGFAPA